MKKQRPPACPPSDEHEMSPINVGRPGGADQGTIRTATDVLLRSSIYLCLCSRKFRYENTKNRMSSFGMQVLCEASRTQWAITARPQMHLLFFLSQVVESKSPIPGARLVGPQAPPAHRLMKWPATDEQQREL